MSRETRRNMKRKAEEKPAKNVTRTATSQPLPQNPESGQASEVIARYFGFQGVPRRFTKPSSDKGSTSSLQSCPASSEDEYENEEAVVDKPSEPVPQRQESTDSSSLGTERLTTTLEPKQKEDSSPPTPRKRRRTISEAGSMTFTESQHDSPPQNEDREVEAMALDSEPSPARLRFNLKPINQSSSDLQCQTQSNTMLGAKPLARSLSPDVSGRPQAHISQPIQRSHSTPPDQAKSSSAPDPAPPRSYLPDEADTSIPRVSVNESLKEDVSQAPTLSNNRTLSTEYDDSTLITTVPHGSSPLSSAPDSLLESGDLVTPPLALESPGPPNPESVPPTELLTTEAYFEPRTSPVGEMDIQAPDPSQAAMSFEPPEDIPVQQGSESSVPGRVSRVRSRVVRKQKLIADSKEERAALVALYVQKSGNLKVIQNTLHDLSNSKFSKGLQETERLLRILGQAEDDGEVTLTTLHRRRVKKLREQDAEVGDGGEKQHLEEDNDAEHNDGDGAGAAELQPMDDNGSTDVSMTDVGDEAAMGSGVRHQHQKATRRQIAEDEEHTEDIIYVREGLRPSRHPLTRVKEAAAKKVKKKKAENISKRWAFHSCVRCRVGLLDEIYEE
ncbi:hypothetical protein B0T21DRAFT_452036 [Apiosordaria backusii]|uniref:Uncharacterized protein n=1 Tax=Apiosordaria backusii TaxID=314023 RepID=A0AA40E8R0_9PEZI|nr:hypothetical protein B0T21DRAFT_452036 [Apiosordaria backusii]